MAGTGAGGKGHRAPIDTTPSSRKILTTNVRDGRQASRLMKKSACQGRRQKGKGRTFSFRPEQTTSPLCLLPSPFQQPATAGAALKPVAWCSPDAADRDVAGLAPQIHIRRREIRAGLQ